MSWAVTAALLVSLGTILRVPPQGKVEQQVDVVPDDETRNFHLIQQV
jgi:hypothetical protein